MLSLEQCLGLEEVGLEEVGPEGVHKQRECTSRGSVQVEEGQSSQRKVQSWTWKCPKPLVDLTEEVEQEQEQT